MLFFLKKMLSKTNLSKTSHWMGYTGLYQQTNVKSSRTCKIFKNMDDSLFLNVIVQYIEL